MERVSVFEVKVLHSAYCTGVPLETAWGGHHVNVLTSLKLGHLENVGITLDTSFRFS